MSKYDKRVEGFFCILSDDSKIKLKVNCKTIYRNSTDMWRLTNILLNGQWVIKK